MKMATQTVFLLAAFGLVALASFCQGAATKTTTKSHQNEVHNVNSKNNVFNDHAKLDVTDDNYDSAVWGKELGQHVDFPLENFDHEELQVYVDLEEQIFMAETDEHVLKKLNEEKRAVYSGKGGAVRRKRIAGPIARGAMAVARALVRSFTKTGVTRSGSRVTQHYSKSGNYQTAVNDFNSMQPSNVKPISSGNINGYTGTVGNHRVTVRDGSSGNSRPTLEIRSHSGDLVRKGRYE